MSKPDRRASGSFNRKLRGWIVLPAVLVGIALLSWASSDAKSAPALSSNLAVERTLIAKGGTRPVYVLIHFSAPDLDVRPNKRPPLNLSLVLDRSGSMSEKGKIEYLRQAAKMAVSQLRQGDTISVVEFDDRITLMWPATDASDAESLKSKIDELTPRGSTNLAGGLDRGIGEASDAFARLRLPHDTIGRVILLSDGLANTGITDHGEIARLSSAARMKGLRVSTIGLGLDYDEDLMQAIAEAGGGQYYYVESPVQLAAIFQQELKSAFATRARDVHLAFHGSSAVKRAELIGFASSSGHDVSADWPDFYAGETRTVLLRLEVDAQTEGPLALGRFDVAWRDVQSGASGTLDLPISVGVTRDAAASDRTENKDVAVEAALAESERDLAGNVKLYQSGRFDVARAGNANVIADLTRKNDTLKDARITRKIEAMNVEQDQMAAAAAAPSPDIAAGYMKASKQRLYQAKSGNRTGYVLQQGDKGLSVEHLQSALSKAGYYKGKITGDFDKATADAVAAYQKANAIPADGVAGAATQAKLGLY